MDLLHNFLKHQLPGAQKGEVISKSITTYFEKDKTFVIGLGDRNGFISEQVKEDLFKGLKATKKKVYFFSLFESKETFQMFCDRISWGSYIWIATEPGHTIHFDSRPKLKLRFL